MRYLVFILVLSACAGKQNLRDFKGSYLESVKLNFDAGLLALSKKDYEKAIAYFQFVKSKYPFSIYAALSDLKIADAKFLQEKWQDAASLYEVFIRLHPRHEESHYAYFRVALSYFYAIPSDFFLLPSKETRDQSFTIDALLAFNRFIEEFPNSPYINESLEKRQILYTSLAQQNLAIANYYRKRKRFKQAYERFLRGYEIYPKTKEAQDALLNAAQIASDNLNDIEKAIELYAIFIDQYRDSPHLKKAKEAISKLLKQKNG